MIQEGEKKIAIQHKFILHVQRSINMHQNERSRKYPR